MSGRDRTSGQSKTKAAIMERCHQLCSKKSCAGLSNRLERNFTERWLEASSRCVAVGMSLPLDFVPAISRSFGRCDRDLAQL
ncbi:hypothetical protein AGR2A_Lc20024 [Agrobacterium genomosp. 2 str. CFBP 5494]|uniref:Uncharacterized protein n=1 Tax=Agrobacterium genomosp. 2 str. CFBP 5494 TaxID=1183436 RepID=A0A9W5B3Z1_9HYPH|nr:hypothetical protein AGR2A_Lc20024 [Agrobacterium genomosp. 2 str. CFBP 5494]